MDGLLKKRPLAAPATLILLTAVVYAGTLTNGFVYDDDAQILENPFIQNPRLWPRIFTGSAWSFCGLHTHFYRPLQFLCYWVMYRLAGPNPAAFHLFQLLLYAATVVLVYLLGRRLFRDSLTAYLGALLWALHPLHVEPVAWISALPDVGFGFFYLLALLLFLRAEKAASGRLREHVCAALAFLVALLFKEMALSLPLLILAYWFFLPTQESRLSRTVHFIPYLSAVGAYAAIRVSALGYLIASRPGQSTPHLAGAALGLLGEHSRLFFWPAHLSAYRTFEFESALRSPWPWLTLVVVLGMLLIRKREPLLSFLIVWWPLALLPCLDIRQLSIPFIADRFSYLPSVGLCLGISFLLCARLPEWVPRARLASLTVAGLVVVMILWAFQTVRAIPHWRDNEALAAHSLNQSPNAAVLHIIQAETLQFRHGDLDGAAREFETALRLNSASLQPLASVTYSSYLGLGLIAQQRGRREEALSYYQRAVQLLPYRAPAYEFLGAFYFPGGDYAKAAEYFAQAVRANPYSLTARFYLGTCQLKLGKYRQAAEQFRAARAVDPTYRQAYEAEARALEAMGDSAGAAGVRGLMPDE
jgi:Tfp pilus assembly protein PilF/4-amino-4-deoxy-L-arabinose transferase-like glycosyltransferase